MAAVVAVAASLAMAQPWDLQRFAKTAFFFNSPQEVLKRVPLPGRQAPSLGPDAMLFSASSSSLLEFGPLDDVVMGGVSESNFVVNADGGTFRGTVRTENNGGFAGCRSKALSPALQLSAYTGIKLRVRGDGVLRRYKAIVRDSYGASALVSIRSSGRLWSSRSLPSPCCCPVSLSSLPLAFLCSSRARRVDVARRRLERHRVVAEL